MHIAFINPQGNFDPADSYWTEHPDFGGQLVYVKELALAMAGLGHKADIITRQILDPKWSEFENPVETYPGHDRVRIIRIPFGGKKFLSKEELWPHLGAEFVRGIIDFYRKEPAFPNAATAHYGDGGITAALLQKKRNVPFTFTGHSLGAQKMDKLSASPENLEKLDERFHFTSRIFAERTSMNHSAMNVVSTGMEWFEQYGHPAYAGTADIEDPGQFRVIPPGVNLSIFGHDVKCERETKIGKFIEEMLGRDIDAGRVDLPLIICASRLDGKKNHLGLVKAFAGSPRLQEKANLAIIVRGIDNPLKDYSRARPEEQAILERIVKIIDGEKLWGKVASFSLSGQEELGAAYRHAARRKSVFALTSHYEPFGLAQLESMAAGLPAVATKNGGPSESMFDAAQNREYGVLVDPGDPADISRGLLKVLESTESWERYQTAGIQRVYKKYNWKCTAQGYLKVIEEILKMDLDMRNLLPIPEFFTNPGPETAITVKQLGDVYFRERDEILTF